MDYSVLMSVYYKEKPEFLRQSMQSVLDQTLPTNDFVLVCDGPLTAELDQVIEEMQLRFGSVLNVVRLPENGGLGKALNQGIQQCRNEIIARMDSDDISFPNRCEEELQCLIEKNVDFLSAGILEFEGSIENTGNMRMPPETYEEIVQFAKRRNPMNHPCSMYRKSAVQKVGGYQDFYLLEDYYLWIRMLIGGCSAYNIQKPLLWMRAGADMYKRRAGLKYAKTQRNLFCFMRKNHFITLSNYISACVIRTMSAMVPNWFRVMVYQIFLRKKEDKVKSYAVK